MKEFTFTNREEYIKWRLKWKEDYLNTIIEIRKSALNRQSANRNYSLNHGSIEDLWSAGSTHRQLKETATALLAARARSKIESGRQRALQKEASIV